MTDPGFDAAILSEFRQRLLTHHAELLLFATMIQVFREHDLLKAKGRQRTDSTHVLAAVQMLNRLECVGETLRHALNMLATMTPVWLRRWVPIAWFDRYSRRFEEYRLPRAKVARYTLAAQIGQDGYELLHQVYHETAPAEARDLAAVHTLRQVWIQQFHPATGEQTVQWRTADDLPPAPLLMRSPYDPEARYGKKRDVEWTGYKVHVTETVRRVTRHMISATSGSDSKGGHWVTQPTGCGNTYGKAACWERRGYPKTWRIGRPARPAPYGKSWIA